VLGVKFGWLTQRLPSQQDLRVVFSITIFIIFSWSIRGFLYQLPSYLLRLDLIDILGCLPI